MKIIEVRKLKGHSVETDKDVFGQYTRYGPDCWYVTMGESEEPVYDCGEIEELFQEYTKALE